MASQQPARTRTRNVWSRKWLSLAAGILMLVGAGIYGSFTIPPAKAAGGTGQAAMTVFFDVAAGARRKRAAKGITELHQKQAEKGWSVIDVEPWIEDGDLEGFFITYVKQN